MNKKRGNIIICFLLLLFLSIMIIFFMIFMGFVDLNIQLDGIKNDLFFICQNAIFAYDYEELSYENYTVDIKKLENNLLNLLTQHYLSKESKILQINIKQVCSITNKHEILMHTNNELSVPLVHIELEVVFSPVLKFMSEDKMKVLLHQDVKLSVMEY